MINLKYVDKWNMITTLYGDGGDSAFHVGHYYYLTNRVDINDACTIVSAKGLMRRHPDETKWYSDWDRMSRDQSIPLLISLFNYKLMLTCKAVFISHLKRGLLFATNTRRNGSTKENDGELYGNKFRDYRKKIPDLTGPTFWAIYIRGFKALYLYPLLLILDLFLFLKVMAFNIKPREPNQLLILLEFSKDHLPTPISWLSNLVLNKKKVSQELRAYWFKEVNYKNVRPYFIGRLWLDRLGL